MSKLTPSQLLAEVEAFSAGPPDGVFDDLDLRTKLYRAFGAAKASVEQPTELVTRLLQSQVVESSLINVALNLELFAQLQEGNRGPKSLASLASSTGADPLLLKRILRALATFGAVQEHGGETYSLSPSHSTLSDRKFGRAVLTCANILQPTYYALAEYVKSTEYEAPSDPKNTVVQQVFGYKDKKLMDILMEKPEWAQAFGTLMSTWGEGHALLQHLYPVKEKMIEGYDANVSKVLFVDVGGGLGQKSIALRQAFPELPGKVVVQDLPMFINNAPEVNGIEFQVHDFFTEQPIKDAKAYYIRQCLHDWSDEACVKILSMLGGAMKPGYSTLLVHELIVPEVGASLWASVQDINMMTLCGVAERTEKEWRELLDRSGLSVRQVYQAVDGVSESVIEAAVNG